MIPKIIHFIWLGNNKIDKKSQICINSAKRLLPDYEINIWTEKNLNINQIRKNNKFLDMCLKKKLWAFASDFLRLYVLSKKGGIYLDTDVEVIKSFNDLLDNECFLGYEKDLVGDQYVGTGIIGAEKNSLVINKFLEFYTSEIWKVEYYNNPIIFTHILQMNPQLKMHIKIYPQNYFCPYVPFSNDLIVNVNCSTYTIHWYNANWGMSLKGYIFLNTKNIKSPLFRSILKIKKCFGYLKKKILKEV